MTTTTITARVFVTTYGIYNDGLQFASDKHGFWIDCDGIDTAQLADDFEALTGDDPELMYTDYEGFPEDLYSESGPDFDAIQEWIDLDDDERELVAVIMDHHLPDFREAMEAREYCRIYEGSPTDYAWDFVEETTNTKTLGWLQNHIDYASIARAMDVDGVFTEIGHNRLLILR